MIFPRDPQTAADVGGHYDELDETYRSIWGEHVHHGYWRTGRETPEEATAEPRPPGRRAPRPRVRGWTLVDIGCGYGATAEQLDGRGESRGDRLHLVRGAMPDRGGANTAR